MANRCSWASALIYESLARDAEINGGIGSRTIGNGSDIAETQISRHDLTAAQLTLQTIKPDPSDTVLMALTHFDAAVLAMELGNPAEAVREMDVYRAGYANPAVSSQQFGTICSAALIEEAAGHREKADEDLRTGWKYVDCRRYRGDILDGRGDWAGAQAAYTDAVARAPDLPAAYHSWGVALAKHGDLPGAATKLLNANKRGPHWADPLKVRGDVLAKQGHPKEALDKYDEALKYAPNWIALKVARAAIASPKT
jgi:predicted negative regulator of RcsB-dependent stress response